MTARTRWLFSCTLLAAACAATGGLAALTAAPPALDVAVWPPTGIALAALAARGRRLWPGVWVATFAVTVPMIDWYAAGAGPLAAAAAAGLIATAYAAQAAAGAWFLRRALGDPLRLVHPREIALFLAVAGPVHTVPAALVSAVVACGHGVRPWADGTVVWASLWWNDVLGGLLFAPITLALVGTPRELWRPRLRTVAAPLVAVAGLTAAGYVAARAQDAAQPRERLRAEADRAAAVLQADSDRLLAGMDAVRRSNDLVTALRSATGRAHVRAELRVLRSICPTARAVAVAEVVPGERVGWFEQDFRRATARLADFRVAARGPDGTPVPVPTRDRHLVVTHVDPLDENEADVGLDLLSDPVVRAAFDRAVDEGRPVATPPAGGSGGAGRSGEFLVVRPYYTKTRPQTSGGRRADVRGALVAVFDRAAVPTVLAAGRDPRVRFVVTDPEVEPPPATPRGGAVATTRVELAGRDWDLHAVAGPAFLAAHATNFAWAAVAAGGAFGLLAAAWLLAMSGRAAAVEEEVARRTAELARQVAARELTEDALRASEERLAEAQRIARLGYWELDPVTGESYWCRASADLLGADAGDDPDLPALVHPDDRPAFERAVREVLETGRRGEVEVRVVRPDRAERWVHAALTADAAEGLYLVRGTLQDVTDRKRTELAVRAGEARLAEAQRIAQAGSWEWDTRTGAVWWSDNLYRLLGHAPGAVTPSYDQFMAAVHPDDRPTIAARIARTLGRDDPYEFDHRVVLPGGEERVFHVDGQLTRDADGQPLLMRGTAQDVTDRVRAEEERRRVDERLQQTQRLESLGVLAGGVAHDFNNLLTGILGNAALARDLAPPGAGLDDCLRPIEQAAAHAAALCQQMLAYAGKGSAVRGAFHLNRLVGDTAGLLRLSASKTAELRFDLAADVPVLDGDATQIRQVLLNLVTNASEAIGTGPGTIEVSTGWGPADDRCRDLAPGLYAWVQVRDTGCGMPPEVVKRIFDPFFTTKFTGRGLGLSAVHGIAKSHGGTVCVTSIPGAGTTFRVYLAVPAGGVLVRTPPPVINTPLRIEHPTRRAAPPPADAGVGAAVVADDDPAVRQLVAVALAGLGFEVRQAENGAEAVELVKAGGDGVRVVVLDVVMPVMDGRAAAAAIRGARPELPVIVMSGYAEADGSAQFAGGGVVGFVQKPFRPADLTACVRRAVARPGRLAPAIG